MAMVAKDIERSRQEGGVFCVIRGKGLTPIGVLDYMPCGFEGRADGAFLGLLMIAEPYRARGIGTQIVGLVEREIRRDQGVRSILSGVQVNNPRAQRFWLGHGYRIVGGPELLPDQTTVYHLRKDLAR